MGSTVKREARVKDIQEGLASVLNREISVQRFVNDRESAIATLSHMINREPGAFHTPEPEPNAAKLVRTLTISNRRKIFLYVSPYLNFHR